MITPIHQDPFGIMMMDSHETSDRIIRDMVQAVENGANPNMIFDDVLKRYGVTENDLAAWDLKRIHKRVDEVYKAKYRRG